MENDEDSGEYEDEVEEELNDELDDFGFSSDEGSDNEKTKTPIKKEPSIYLKAEDFVINGGSKSATERLLRDLTNIKKLDPKNIGFEATPIEDNLYKWEVKLYFDNDSQIGRDLEEFSKKTGQNYVKLHMTFPRDYPFSPPFIRVILPRFVARHGHVTTGGSICMELLTPSGWTAGLFNEIKYLTSEAQDIEFVLVQIRATIVSGDGRLGKDAEKEYTETEAMESFTRVAKSNGWLK